MIKRTRQETGVTGSGIFDLYLGNTLKDLRTERPEIIEEMREISSQFKSQNSDSQYSRELLTAIAQISDNVLFLFDALFLQHYRAYINSHHPNPKQILVDGQGLKSRMHRYILDILIRDVDYYIAT